MARRAPSRIPLFNFREISDMQLDDIDAYCLDALAAENGTLGVLSPGFGLRLEPEAARGALTLATDLHSPTARG
jgi:hypothetical protein